MKSEHEARIRFLEIYGSALSTSSYLKLILAGVSLCLMASICISGLIVHWAWNKKPLVIRIDEVGRATAVNYNPAEYRPQEPELRYFLAQFVTHYYSRLLSTVREQMEKSHYFLSQNLSDAALESEARTGSLAKFIQEGSEENAVEIRNVLLQDIRSATMRASVDFDKVYFLRTQRVELRRERFTASIEFIVSRDIPNSFILVNPLGLTVTHIQLDEAFKP